MNSTTIQLNKFCTEKTNVNATEFLFYTNNDSEELFRYRFGVAANGDSDKQELFIFKEKPFGLIKNTGRFELVYQSQDENYGSNSKVGSLLFKTEPSGKNILIFYSDNSDKMNHAEGLIWQNTNGKEIERRIQYYLIPNDAFVIFSTELEEYEQIKGFVFSNDTETIYSY